MSEAKHHYTFEQAQHFVAAQLMAGLDGIKNQLDPTEAGFGPIDANIFSWDEEQRSHIQPLPASLNEALSALEADHAFLTEGGSSARRCSNNGWTTSASLSILRFATARTPMK